MEMNVDELVIMTIKLIKHINTLSIVEANNYLIELNKFFEDYNYSINHKCDIVVDCITPIIILINNDKVFVLQIN